MTSVRAFQVTFDCADPERLARFWCEVLGYVIPPPPEGFATWDEAERALPPERQGSGFAIVDPTGVGPRLFFQRVPEGNLAEPTTGPSAPTRKHNRLHLDIRAGDEDRDDVVASLIARGAAKLWDGHQGPYRWVTMVDPEGNEFCVA